MYVPSHSPIPMASGLQKMEQAISRLMRGVAMHLDRETRLTRSFAVSEDRWSSQFEELRCRLEELEARLAPWIRDQEDGPRLAVVPVERDVNDQVQ